MTVLKRRRVYSTEELHRLRGSQSLPRMREAIEQYEGEDAKVVKAAHAHERLRQCADMLAASPGSPGSDGGVPLLTPDLPPEHVLRGTKSFAARSLRSCASTAGARVPSNQSDNETFQVDTQGATRSATDHVSDVLPVPILGEISHNAHVLRSAPFRLRPSPTPSMKRKKVEAILQAHGSPTHVRVTAGGRIVPSEQSPLCHPRYGYSAVKVNGGLIKLAPNYNVGKPQWTPATENGFVAQDMDGNLCQIVNGTIQPLFEINGALQLHMPAPNLQVTSRGSSLGPSNHSALQQDINQHSIGPVSNTAALPDSAAGPQSKVSVLAEPSIASQISALELEYSKLERELKDVDKTEVIHGRTMARVAKDALISKRRELVVSMDKIRKAVKALKNRPPPKAPLSPRAVTTRDQTSPSRNRLPAFLKMPQMTAMGSGHPSYYHATTQPTGTRFAALSIPPSAPSPEELYGSQAWPVLPTGSYIPPASYDGSMTQAFAPVSQYDMFEPLAAFKDLAQNDGAAIMADVQIPPPDKSHAVQIMAPETKPVINLKSNLNPMSPVYKPAGLSQLSGAEDRQAPEHVKDRAPTPFGSLQPLQSLSHAHQGTQLAMHNGASPVKMTGHLNSSSVSSFETADFFPRNTNEYSVRHNAYPNRVESSGDKENFIPEPYPLKREESPESPNHSNSNWNPSIPDGAFKDFSPAPRFQAPAPPPGTPVHDATLVVPVPGDDGFSEDESHGFRVGVVPDRDADNVSPKTKRNSLFISDASVAPLNPSLSSPDKQLANKEEGDSTSSPQDAIDFSQKPREWIEGYQAGLHRRPVGADRMGSFLDGYCSGLLKSQSAISAAALSPIVPSTSSPMRSHSRRPSPVVPPRTFKRLQLVDKVAVTRPTLETAAQSMDTLKEAVYAPHNENAILTPLPDGMHVNEMFPNLGAWAKARGEPQPSGEAQEALLNKPTSAQRGDGGMNASPSTGPATNQNRSTTSPVLGATSASTLGSARDLGSVPATRVTSLTSIDSNLYRQWPGRRMISPFEWKSGSSVAQVANFAGGYFGHSQFDGASQRPVSITSGDTNDAMLHHSRFYENSLDGINSPPISPRGAPSSPISPNATPRKDSGRKNDGAAPKSPSPAKARFEHIAEKVGIKASIPKHPSAEAAGAASGNPASPPGKRRWRDVWRKPAGKDDQYA